MNELAKAIEAAARASPEFVGLAPPVTLLKERILLIDGDILAYSASGSDDTPTGVARRNLFSKIRTLKEMAQASKVYVHLTSAASHKGYRYLAAVTQPYQGNRKALVRPKNWKALRDVMETYDGSEFKVILWHDREADDGMAYHVEKLQAGRKPEDIYLCTRDKDLRMITGCVHINWEDYTTILVPYGAWYVENPYDPDKPFGTKWFWIQMLAGDTVDNIRGVRGVAVKTAMKKLAKCDYELQAADVVYNEYVKEYGKDKAGGVMYEHALLLWLRRTKEAHVFDVPVLCLYSLTSYFNELREKINEYNKINRDILEGLQGATTG